MSKDVGMPTPYERPDRATTAPAGDQRAVRTLHRPVEGRIIGGVCAGLAVHLGLNVRLVRLVFVLLALPGPASWPTSSSGR